MELSRSFEVHLSIFYLACKKKEKEKNGACSISTILLTQRHHSELTRIVPALFLTVVPTWSFHNYKYLRHSYKLTTLMGGGVFYRIIFLAFKRAVRQ